MTPNNISTIASTPATPYYSVIFTSIRAAGDDANYSAMADCMLLMAAEQDGFLGAESVRDSCGVGITVSYWRDLESIERWHGVEEHRQAQSLGRLRWYDCFSVRICKVERDYNFCRPADRSADS